MPLTTIRVYRDRKGDVPLKEWLDSLEEAEPRAYRKCLQRIVLLADKGSDLRRPHADKLRDGICELRARVELRPIHRRMGDLTVARTRDFAEVIRQKLAADPRLAE